MIVGKLLRFIFDEFIYGGHLQSLGAVAIILTSGLLLKIKITLDILLIVYLIFYLLYLYNRFKEIDIDYLTNPARTCYIKTYIKYIPIIIFLTLFLLTLILIYFANLSALVFGVLLILFGFAYTALFKDITSKIPFLKNIYVSMFFALLVFFLVIYYAYPLTISLSVGILGLSIFVYLKAFLMQVFLDIKDVQSDYKKGLCTLSVMIGKDKTINFLKVMSILVTCLFPIIFSIYFNIFPKSILMLILVIPFNFYCFSLAKRRKYYGYILGSGEFILWPILILIGEILL